MVIVCNIFSTKRQSNKPKSKNAKIRVVIKKTYTLYYILGLLIGIILLAISMIYHNKHTLREEYRIAVLNHLQGCIITINKILNSIKTTGKNESLIISKATNGEFFDSDRTDSDHTDNENTDNENTDNKKPIDKLLCKTGVDNNKDHDNDTIAQQKSDYDKDTIVQQESDHDKARRILNQLKEYVTKIKNKQINNIQKKLTHQEMLTQLQIDISDYNMTINDLTDLKQRYVNITSIQEIAPETNANPEDIIKDMINNYVKASNVPVYDYNIFKSKFRYELCNITKLINFQKEIIKNTNDSFIVWLALAGGNGKTVSIEALSYFLQARRITFNPQLFQVLYYAYCLQIQISQALKWVIEAVFDKNAIKNNEYQYLVLHFEEFMDADYYISDQFLQGFFTSLKMAIKHEDKQVICAFSGNYKTKVEYQKEKEEVKSQYLIFNQQQQTIIHQHLELSTYRTITQAVSADCDIETFRNQVAKNILGPQEHGNSSAFGRRIFRPVISTQQDLLIALLCRLYNTKSNSKPEYRDVGLFVCFATNYYLNQHSSHNLKSEEITLNRTAKLIEKSEEKQQGANINVGLIPDHDNTLRQFKLPTGTKITSDLFFMIGKICNNILEAKKPKAHKDTLTSLFTTNDVVQKFNKIQSTTGEINQNKNEESKNRLRIMQKTITEIHSMVLNKLDTVRELKKQDKKKQDKKEQDKKKGQKKSTIKQLSYTGAENKNNNKKIKKINSQTNLRSKT